MQKLEERLTCLIVTGDGPPTFSQLAARKLAELCMNIEIVSINDEQLYGGAYNIIALDDLRSSCYKEIDPEIKNKPHGPIKTRKGKMKKW